MLMLERQNRSSARSMCGESFYNWGNLILGKYRLSPIEVLVQDRRTVSQHHLIIMHVLHARDTIMHVFLTLF